MPLLHHLLQAPDCLRMVLAVVEPHTLAKIKRTCKQLRRAVSLEMVIECIHRTQLKYSQVYRMPDGALRMHSRLGRFAYDIYPITNEAPKHNFYYLLRTVHGCFRGYISRMLKQEDHSVCDEKRTLFNATNIHTSRVFYIETDGSTRNFKQIIVSAQIEFPDGSFASHMYFTPCALDPPFAFLEYD